MRVVSQFTYYAIKELGNEDYFIARKGQPFRYEFENFKFKRLGIAIKEGSQEQIEVFIRTDIGKRNEVSVIAERDYNRVLSNALLLNSGKAQTKSICEW